jgi:hypothetical protein
MPVTKLNQPFGFEPLLGESEELITFESSDFYYRRSTPKDANVWRVGIYAFAIGAVPPLRFEGEQAAKHTRT